MDMAMINVGPAQDQCCHLAKAPIRVPAPETQKMTTAAINSCLTCLFMEG